MQALVYKWVCPHNVLKNINQNLKCNFCFFQYVPFCPILVQPTKFPHAQFFLYVLTSKECIHAVFVFGFKIRLLIWWINLRYASNFIHNKGHIFMNFDGMILTFYTWICVVHCVHQGKCLKTLHFKFGYNYDFINFYY